MKEKKKDRLYEQYKLLINARNFHYENFNKWMTYYYVAIGALFVGYYNLESSCFENHFVDYSIMILGFTVGCFWYWSCKGYYYWNINFITLVNNFEKEILKLDERKRVYMVFANKSTQNNYLSPISGANISTSKVTILFSFIITTMWGVLLFYKIFVMIDCIGKCMVVVICFSLLSSIMLILLLSITIPKNLLKSKIDHFPDLKIQQDS